MTTLLVLDLDQTLIDSDDDGVVTERPHLRRFLESCMQLFSYVAIWTRAKQSWVDHVLRNAPTLARYAEKFLFIWTYDQCSVRIVLGGYYSGQDHIRITKPLERASQKCGIPLENIWLLDDLAENNQDNRPEAFILCKPFDADAEKNDTELLNILMHLQRDPPIPASHHHP